MPDEPEPDERRPADLGRSLGAIRRLQHVWLADLEQTAARGDLAFVAAFRRWEEQLSALKLHLHRAEGRLLHYLGTDRQWREWKGQQPDRLALANVWRERLNPWFATLRLDTSYRHLESVLDLDEEPGSADIITDLVTCAEVADATLAPLAELAEHPDPALLEDIAYYHVLSPWKQRGHLPLLDVLRWLAEILREHDVL